MTMRFSKFPAWACACFLLLAGAPTFWAGDANAQTAASGDAAAEKPDNEVCLGCHGEEGFSAPAANGEMRDLFISPERFGNSVHGKRACVDCHKDIIEIPHREGVDRKVGCVQCHRSLWDTARREGKTKEFPLLGVVVKQIDSYMDSIHARPSMADQSRTNATCYDCHNAHYVYPIDTSVGSASRFDIPEICGRCHAKQKNAYLESVHGKEVMLEANAYAAVCTDCHTTHTIKDPHGDPVKLAITKNCGNCHSKQYETYTGTYHGQVSILGYAHTAKCFDCHGDHNIQRVDDPTSMVYKTNRLHTCQQCHKNATAGFISFQPHGNTSDFKRYPFMWIAAKGMITLLIGVFAFFWTHSALWFYREYKDRKEGKNKLHIKVDMLPDAEKKYFKRWPALWRLAHLIFAVAIMTLVLTGTAVLYAESSWAKAVMLLLGGPQVAAILHRIAAATFISLFVAHLIYLLVHLSRVWKTFKIFGPDSLVPNWQDLKDAADMFAWFFGLRSRPVFDRWTYWEKFDYWAPFWGMTIIGMSGAMLWFPTETAKFLPGWVFNVATIVHGEEAFLAAVFLFSVHFFNVHFRPDKFPQDTNIFTGVMPLEEYVHEHTLEYRRLVDSGEIDKYLVEAPSRPMSRGASILGGTLIIVGLTLLVMVLSGFLRHVIFG